MSRPGVQAVRHPDGYKIRFYRELAEAIRRQRHASGLTMKQVATACAVSVSTVDKWEEGVTSIPAFALHMLEKTFGCNLYDLMPVMGEDDEAAA